ncbi:hypothetical protein DRO97_00615 [Archaeoglobales archaeon]|nr:MAG: hypothetical protein DRO97_00615 [Archaeoglobales archaeon]
MLNEEQKQWLEYLTKLTDRELAKRRVVGISIIALLGIIVSVLFILIDSIPFIINNFGIIIIILCYIFNLFTFILYISNFLDNLFSTSEDIHVIPKFFHKGRCQNNKK